MNARRPWKANVLIFLVILAGLPNVGYTAGKKKTNQYVPKYKSLLKEADLDKTAGQLSSAVKTPAAAAELDGAVTVLLQHGTKALPLLQSLRKKDAVATAELLWRIAQKKGLTDELATLAAELLKHEEPFARALAEWAIATKVGIENNGQEIAWPRPDPPEWYQTWVASLTPELQIEADYVRMAVGWYIQHSKDKLLSSIGAIQLRAQGAAAEVRRSGSAEARAMVTRQLAELESIHAKAAEHVKTAPDDMLGHRRAWLAARRAARPIVMANPAIDFNQIVFIKRHAAHSHRNITGSQYPWVHKPGGDICIQTGFEPGGPVRGVLQGKLGPGHVHGMDLWWDADRVVFGYARQAEWPPPYDAIHGNHVFLLRGDQEPTHIYEICLDGSGLKQLTNDPYWSDLEPTYCADGDVVFASDRSGRSSECGRFSADHTVINLYAVSPDGTNLRRLNDNKDIDRYPHSLDNGLIAYTRWEYQERHFFEVHAIWTIRPDGTKADAVFNQHLKWPCGLRDVRSIPNSNKLVAVATGHHTFAYGPVVVVDPSQGINESEAMKVVTPYSMPQEGATGAETVPEGGVPDQRGLYQTPWALSERCFLVSYSHARPPSGSGGGDNANGFALYLIDAYGNKELVHRDPVYSCSFPIPLRERPRPPILPDATIPDERFATCYVSNIYHGMEGVPEGTVKYIRISQRIGWPLDSNIGAMRWIPGNAWERKLGFHAWAPVRVIGTVRVEKDGSAHFKVPVNKAVYFQALDENHMEIRRMRSHVTFQPGEARGCLGCHETKLKTPATGWRVPLALNHPPETPEPPSWGPKKLLGYEWLIQPIFDRHCVRCHGSEKPDGGLDLTATRADDGFYQSFRTLFGVTDNSKKFGRRLVSISNRFSGAGITQPMEFGSHKSPLVRVLLDDKLHKEEVKLSETEWVALVTWVDANVPYYDTFFNRRPKDGGQPRHDVLLEFPLPPVGIGPALGSSLK